MLYRKKTTCILVLLLALAFTVKAQFPPTDPAYHLAFNDEFDTLFPTIVNCVSYVFEYIQLPNPENNWNNKVDTKRRSMISGLTPGSQYAFRCAYLGTKGQGPWSDLITRFIS